MLDNNKLMIPYYKFLKMGVIKLLLDYLQWSNKELSPTNRPGAGPAHQKISIQGQSHTAHVSPCHQDKFGK